MELIGITGYARHGKDTVAARLVDKWGFRRYAFAAALKEMALVLDPIMEVRGSDYATLSDLVDNFGWESAKQVTEVRRFLQVLGTEAVRDMIGPDSWVNVVVRKINDERPERAVISDVRFPNEAAAVWMLGGRVWRVNRPGIEMGVGRGHASESKVDEITADLEILNADTIESLNRYVDSRYASSIKSRHCDVCDTGGLHVPTGNYH